VVTNRDNLHSRKSVLGFGVARGEFGELMRGKRTRFDCIEMNVIVTVEAVSGQRQGLSVAASRSRCLFKSTSELRSIFSYSV